MNKLKLWFSEAWEQNRTILLFLLPLTWLYAIIIKLRKFLYTANILPSYKAPVPVLVVGNISVGGSGKTPVVAAISKYFQSLGYNPGIVSRGYGRNNGKTIINVTPTSDPSIAGDEPVMLAKQTQLPIVVGANRPKAIQHLLQTNPVNLIISDDGLQHYAMQRDAEMIVVNTAQLNAKLLPAGPLREKQSRLNSANILLDDISLNPVQFNSVATTPLSRPIDYFKDKEIVVVTAIANPTRFYKTLQQLGAIIVASREFADHYRFQSSDFGDLPGLPVIMTAKDAVKCEKLHLTDAWWLEVEYNLDDDLKTKLAKVI